MTSVDNGKHNPETGESNSDPTKGKGQIPFDVSTSRKTLLTGDKSPKRFHRAVMASPNRISFLKFGSASARFKRIADQKDEVSRSVSSSSPHGLRERVNVFFSQKIDWASLMKMGKEWIRNPMNMALFLWIAVVAISGAILFLVMTGMLNAAIPKKSQRDVWFEVNNQILNALFTLMCLYNHPKRFYHLVLLCRWNPEDVSKLRKVYCKNGTYKPHEWAHMMVVVILLHVNCFAQYALCGLNLGYSRSERPAIGVGICISFAIGAPAFAGVYSIVSPLGKDYDPETDVEAQNAPAIARLGAPERRYSFASQDAHRTVETNPAWSGGIFDFWDDIALAYLSLFCSFCVFGWNMERLGFGNMYVHVATFILFCMAPFWIFNLAAVTIDNETVRESMAVTGVVLCVFGLLYGGFWRIQMRKRFNLPSYTFCCGKPGISDCALWLCCCWCTLAQEVRTGNAYDIVEDKFCRKEETEEAEGVGGSSPMRSCPSSPKGYTSSPSSKVAGSSPGLSRFSNGNGSPEMERSGVGASPARGMDRFMTPPVPSLIEREGDGLRT